MGTGQANPVRIFFDTLSPVIVRGDISMRQKNERLQLISFVGTRDSNSGTFEIG